MGFSSATGIIRLVGPYNTQYKSKFIRQQFCIYSNSSSLQPHQHFDYIRPTFYYYSKHRLFIVMTTHNFSIRSLGCSLRQFFQYNSVLSQSQAGLPQTVPTLGVFILQSILLLDVVRHRQYIATTFYSTCRLQKGITIYIYSITSVWCSSQCVFQHKGRRSQSHTGFPQTVHSLGVFLLQPGIEHTRRSA